MLCGFVKRNVGDLHLCANLNLDMLANIIERDYGAVLRHAHCVNVFMFFLVS